MRNITAQELLWIAEFQQKKDEKLAQKYREEEKELQNEMNRD